MKLETRAKAILRRTIGGWSESYEPGRGSGVGYPDLQFLVRFRETTTLLPMLVPVEVKMGREICGLSGGKIVSKRIRPAQISWHHSFQEAGGVSFVFVCFGSGAEFRAWAIPSPVREVTSKWQQGWEVSKCKLVVKGSELLIDLSSLVAARSSERN